MNLELQEQFSFTFSLPTHCNSIATNLLLHSSILHSFTYLNLKGIPTSPILNNFTPFLTVFAFFCGSAHWHTLIKMPTLWGAYFIVLKLQSELIYVLLLPTANCT